MEKYKLTPAEIEGLEKMGLSREEIDSAEQIVSTYENWLDPNYKILNFSKGIDYLYRLENGDYTPKKGEGHLTLFILPEIEGQKIEQRKSEILEGYVEAYTKALTDFFNLKYRGSNDRNRLVQQEMERLNALIYQNEKKVTYGVFTESLVLYLYTFPGAQKGSMYYHYDEIIVKGSYWTEPKDYIKRHHTDKKATDLFGLSDGLHFVVAALACDRFKSYLYTLLEGNEPAPKKSKAGKSKELAVLPDLNEVLRYPERLPALWTFLSDKGVSDFFDESGYIGSSERSAAPLMGVANGLRISSQIKADFTETDVYISLCKRFNVANSGEPHKARKTTNFKDVRDWVKEFFGET